MISRSSSEQSDAHKINDILETILQADVVEVGENGDGVQATADLYDDPVRVAAADHVAHALAVDHEVVVGCGVRLAVAAPALLLFPGSRVAQYKRREQTTVSFGAISLCEMLFCIAGSCVTG